MLMKKFKYANSINNGFQLSVGKKKLFMLALVLLYFAL